MAKIKREIKKQPLIERVANANAIAAACTGNPDASTLTTKLTALATATTNLENAVSAAQAAQDAAQSAVTAQGAVADAWNLAFDALADAAVTSTSGNAAKIEGLGMEPYTPGGAPPVGLPGQVLNLSATTGDFDGQVDVAYDKVAGARSYEIQVTTTPLDASSYHHAATSLKSTATVSGLTSGTKYWFRVAAIGSAGQGPWSDPAQKMAP